MKTKNLLKLSFLIISICMLSCNESSKPVDKDSIINDESNSDKNDGNAILTEDAALDLIADLSEYKETENSIKEATANKSGASMLLEEENNRFVIKLGYNCDVRFETYYHFYVDKSSKKISVLDVIEGDEISLEEYRKKY